jgi:hypothetical protein
MAATDVDIPTHTPGKMGKILHLLVGEREKKNQEVKEAKKDAREARNAMFDVALRKISVIGGGMVTGLVRGKFKYQKKDEHGNVEKDKNGHPLPLQARTVLGLKPGFAAFIASTLFAHKVPKIGKYLDHAGDGAAAFEGGRMMEELGDKWREHSDADKKKKSKKTIPQPAGEVPAGKKWDANQGAWVAAGGELDEGAQGRGLDASTIDRIAAKVAQAA